MAHHTNNLHVVSRCLAVAERSNHLEELLDVKVLLRRDDVDHAVKVVLLLTVQELGNVSCQVPAPSQNGVRRG